VSDAPQGEGWWLASDGRWYPPQADTRPPPPPAPTPFASTPYTPIPGTPPSNGMAVAALVLGIVGVVFGLIPFTAVIALICGVLAFTFGLVGRGRPGRTGMATAGTALGAIAVVMAIVGFFLLADTVNDVSDAFDEFDEGFDEFQEQQAEEDRDVVLEDCVERDARMVAVLRVTNNSSERSDYTINVNFSDQASGDLIGSQLVTVDDLAPGQSTDAEAAGTEEVPVAGFDCELGSVDRLANI
jgi:hypothetical protein